MKKETKILLFIIGILILVALGLILLFTFRGSSGGETCIDINNELDFDIAACYDAYGGKIYIELLKHSDGYFVSGFEFSFFDYDEKSFIVSEDMWNGESFYYKVPAERNPAIGYFDFKVSDSGKCDELLSVPIGYCPASFSEANLKANLTLVSQGSIENFIEIGSESTSDFLSKELVDRDAVWTSVCESNWDCGSWSDCFEGVQKRECVDIKECSVPTNIPQRVRECDGFCSEDWSCEWSKCSDGVSIPTCVDLNNCGTERDKPTAMSCTKDCTPDVTCEDWSTCNVDYDLLDVKDNEYYYNGYRERICKDSNGCVSPIIEKEECSLQVDVYTRAFTKCGKEYVGIYNSLTDEILATMQKSGVVPSLNINLKSSSEDIYCDYCYDGILNGDEEQIDCGGSCPSCEGYVVYDDYNLNFFEKIVKWFTS